MGNKVRICIFEVKETWNCYVPWRCPKVRFRSFIPKVMLGVTRGNCGPRLGSAWSRKLVGRWPHIKPGLRSYFLLFSCHCCSCLLELPHFYEQANEVASPRVSALAVHSAWNVLFPGVCLVALQPSPKSWISATLTAPLKLQSCPVSHTSHSYAFFLFLWHLTPMLLQKLAFRMSYFLSDQM